MGVILSLFFGVIPAIVYALFVYWLDRYEKESKLLLVGVFIWGALVAAGGAFIINTLFGISIFLVTGSDAATEFATGSISAPLVEETLKGMAVLIVFLIFYREFDNILDGIVYAMIAALGFAATENSFYIYSFGYAESGFGGAVFLAFIRNVVVGWQHPFYTSFIGIGLAIARLNKKWLVRLGAPAIGWGLAVLTHSVHNTLATFLPGFGGLLIGSVLDWSGWFFMFLVTLWAIRREQTFLKKYLQDEVVNGVISRRQYRTAISSFSTSRARLSALMDGKYKATHRFYHLLAELGHKKRHFAEFGEERGNSQMIRKLRAEIISLAPLAGV